MDWFDDLQIEDFSNQDFVENSLEELFADEAEEKFFTQCLKSQNDF